MNIEKFEKWLISSDNKKPNSANSYKTAFGRLESFYYENSGIKESFLNADVSKLKELVLLFETEDPYKEFGLKSNSTNINALRALFRYRTSLDSIEKALVHVQEIITTPHFQSLINSDVFYFQKLTDLFEEYKNFELETIPNDFLVRIKNKSFPFNFKKLLDEAEGSFKEFLLLIGKMITVFDEKGYNTREWNPYEDRRRMSRSMLSQRFWTYYLIDYKLSGVEPVTKS